MLLVASRFGMLREQSKEGSERGYRCIDVQH